MKKIKFSIFILIVFGVSFFVQQANAGNSRYYKHSIIRPQLRSQYLNLQNQKEPIVASYNSKIYYVDFQQGKYWEIKNRQELKEYGFDFKDIKFNIAQTTFNSLQFESGKPSLKKENKLIDPTKGGVNLPSNCIIYNVFHNWYPQSKNVDQIVEKCKPDIFNQCYSKTPIEGKKTRCFNGCSNGECIQKSVCIEKIGYTEHILERCSFSNFGNRKCYSQDPNGNKTICNQGCSNGKCIVS